MLIAGYVSFVLLIVDRTSFDLWGGVLLAPALVILALPALRHQSARESDAGTFRLLLVALVVKLAGAVARYYVAFTVYGGVADAARYHSAGAALAVPFRNLDFTSFHLTTGTPFVENVTGLVYALIGPSKMGGFLFFSWLGFWSFLFYRVFHDRGALREASVVRILALLPPVARLLAVEHREGSLDDVHARPGGLRGGEDPGRFRVARADLGRHRPLAGRDGDLTLLAS